MVRCNRKYVQVLYTKRFRQPKSLKLESLNLDQVRQSLHKSLQLQGALFSKLTAPLPPFRTSRWCHNGKSQKIKRHFLTILPWFILPCEGKQSEFKTRKEQYIFVQLESLRQHCSGDKTQRDKAEQRVWGVKPSCHMTPLAALLQDGTHEEAPFGALSL